MGHFCLLRVILVGRVRCYRPNRLRSRVRDWDGRKRPLRGGDRVKCGDRQGETAAGSRGSRPSLPQSFHGVCLARSTLGNPLWIDRRDGSRITFSPLPVEYNGSFPVPPNTASTNAYKMSATYTDGTALVSTLERSTYNDLLPRIISGPWQS